MNLLELGDLLKREREKRGLSVRDVMETTKISRRNLNALEAGEIKLLPHPVYLKGYVRNYAHMVGLNADPLVAVVEQQSDGESGYIKQVVAPVPAPVPAVVPDPPAQPVATQPEPVQPEAAAAPTAEPEAVAAEAAPATQSFEPTPEPPASQEPEPPAPVAAPSAPPESQIRYSGATNLGGDPPRRVWPWIVLLVIAGIMAVLYAQFRRIEAEVEQKPAPVAAPAQQVNASEANATQEPKDEQNATEPANATLPAATPEPAPQPAASSAPAAGKPLPAQTAPPVVSASPVEVSRKTPAPATEVRTPGMQQLVVTAKANEVCWIELTEGSQRKSLTLRSGDSTRFEFSNKVRIRLGNAGGVSFSLNGAPYPFEGERGATATVEIGAR